MYLRRARMALRSASFALPLLSTRRSSSAAPTARGRSGQTERLTGSAVVLVCMQSKSWAWEGEEIENEHSTYRLNSSLNGSSFKNTHGYLRRLLNRSSSFLTEFTAPWTSLFRASITRVAFARGSLVSHGSGSSST
jgi:hypothetical protein